MKAHTVSGAGERSQGARVGLEENSNSHRDPGRSDQTHKTSWGVGAPRDQWKKFRVKLKAQQRELELQFKACCCASSFIPAVAVS